MKEFKEYKSPLKLPASGYELVTCHYPLRLDVYSGCIHDCIYCYAKKLLTARGMWDPNNIKVADLAKIERSFENAFRGKGWSSISKALRHRLPVRLGGMTDCFQEIERETKTALKLLQMLNHYDYPYMIVTKSDLLSDEEYLKELKKGKSYIQITIISLEEKKLKTIEPGAPSVKSRITTLRKLSDNGIPTCARLSPVIPYLSTDRIEEYVKLVSDAGVKNILAEFFRGTKSNIRQIEELTGVSFFHEMERKGTYYRANIKFKNTFYKKLKSLCTKNNIDFSVCSDGDLVPLKYNTMDNCCGTDKIVGFESCSTCTANSVAKEVAELGEITLDQMKEKYWNPGMKAFEEMWNEGRIENLVEGIKKEGDSYQRKK